MKKSKLSLCMISCLLAVGSLAGCDKVRSSSDGVLLTYYVGGEKHEIKADDILEEYYDDSSKYQAIYDQIYSVIVRNYFAKERTPGKLYPTAPEVPLGKSQMDEINRNAELKVEDDKATAKTNAKANKTRYKKEFEAIWQEKGVKSEKELLQKYVEDLQKETFENNFYTYSLEEIKSGNNGEPISVSTGVKDVDDFVWNGYINDKLPYHVSHVMVALSDSSDTNYYNGTISETDALKLANMVDSLESSTKSFASVAADSDDTGSGEKGGDLGIMDFDTTFINEFKLGVYAYESIYKGTDLTITGSTEKEIIDMSFTNYKELVEDTFGLAADELPTIDPSVFDELREYADDEKALDGNSVIGGSTLVLPRNIIYNQYLNNHSIFFIAVTETYKTTSTYNVDDLVLYSDKVYRCIEKIETPEAFNAAHWSDDNPKYRKFNDKHVLHAQVGKDINGNPVYEPIVCVRGASGDKQEIHFIVVNRSPFDEDKAVFDPAISKANREVNGVKLSEYYTTFSPREAGYPKYEDGKNKTTYVNSLNNDESQNRERATEFASKLKSYDSDKIGKYMFLKYMNEEEITFGENSSLAEALMKWINASVQQSKDTSEESWKKTVNDYIEKLTKQKAERTKLLPQLGVLMFKYANENRTAKAMLDAGDMPADDYNKAKALLVSEKVVADAAAAETFLNNNKICDLYRVKGGLFNDGETHND